jgi:hypothetical protein
MRSSRLPGQTTTLPNSAKLDHPDVAIWRGSLDSVLQALQKATPEAQHQPSSAVTASGPRGTRARAAALIPEHNCRLVASRNTRSHHESLQYPIADGLQR